MLFHKRNRRKRQATNVHRLLLQVLQLEDRCLPSVVLGTHYGGVSFASSGCRFCEPPNANAAAGPNHVVEILDPGFIQINDKAGNLISTERLATFFAPLTPASQMDPFVLFDDSIVNSSGPNGRFIVGVLDFTSKSAPDSLDFAVSDSADPTGPFTEMHKISVGEGSFFADFPREGFNADAYVISFNMLNTSTGSFDHAQELTIQKSSVIDKNNATLTTFHADTGSGGTGHSTLAPALMHGSTTGDPMWFVTEGLSANQVDVIKMTNVLSNTPTFQDNNFSVTAYSHPPLPRQPGGTINNTQFDTGILNAVMRNNVLVADHNVGTGGGDHARWYQFTISGGTPSLTQSGDVNPGANIDTYYPAIEIDANGKLGMTFMQSSSSEFMSMYVTGRAASDASGTMETEQSVIEGVATYGFSRLGAYSGISVDPATGTSFWAANEYATSDLWWGTEVANFSVVVTTFSATLVGNTLQITDNSGGVTALIRLKAGDPTTLEVLNNGSVAASFSFSSINNITVSLTGGNNQLTIDASNGDPVPSGGLSYDGGPTNTLGVNYAADTGSRTITLDTTTPLGDTPFGTIAGEAAGVISYEYADTSSATLTTGTGSDTLTVISTGTAVSLTDSAAATINIGNGNLNSLSGAVTVNGSGGATQVNVNDQSNSTVSTYTITATSVSRSGFAGLTYSHLAGLTLNGGSAGDTYNIQGTASGTTTTANGGAASSTFTVGSASNSLDPILGTLTINAGAGTANTLNVNDQGSSAANIYTVTSSSVNRNGTAAINYSGLASLILNGSSGGSTYNLEGTAAGTSTTVNAGVGNDAFSITPTNQNFSNIAGALVINGGGGTDSLTVDDQLDATADTYTIASGSVQRTGSAGMTFTNIASLTVNGGSSGDTFNINSTAAGTPVTVSGGTGNDIFNLAPSSDLLDTIQGAVTVADSGGSNTVNLDDQNKPGTQTYTVTATTISRAGFAGLVFGSMQVLVLNGGSAADIYNIQSTSAATTVNGGAGNDTFNVGNAGVLDGILGGLTVNGNLGTNTLNVDDHGNAVGQSFALSSTALTRSGGVSLTYGTIKTVNIKAGGNDMLTVLTPVPTVAINFDAGGGNNTMTGPNVANTWTITAANHGTLGKIIFSNVQNLIGGTGNDTFKFVGAGAKISGNLAGGGGADKLDYSANGGGAISVNLQTGVATAIGGTFSGISSLVGTTNLGNTLTAANTTNLWNITGLDLGKVNAFNFSKIENLVGGTGLDTFKFSPAGKETNISGGGAPAGQGDWLDYSSFTALSPVNVNLLLGTASNVTGAINGIENVIGGAGADLLTGDNNGNILIEHGGAGTINGGTGRSLFITGTGAVTVNGGSGGDLFIGGKTSYDTSSTGHLDLMYILAEWKSADPYTTRTDEITDGAIPGHTGVKLAVGSTVTLNPSTTAEHLNALASLTDLDWFFASSTSQYSTPETGELVNNDPN